MKKSFLSIAIILLLTQGVYSQTNGALQKPDSKQIAEIDKMQQEMKAHLGSYTKTEVVNDNTGYRYNYKKGKELQLVSVSSIDKKQNLTKVVEWYFNNGQLIYAEQIYKERSSNKIMDKEKFYLNNEHLFAWYQGGTWKDVNSSDFKKLANDLPAYAAQLKADSMK